jgi:hypothetical protein
MSGGLITATKRRTVALSVAWAICDGLLCRRGASSGCKKRPLSVGGFGRSNGHRAEQADERAQAAVEHFDRLTPEAHAA